MVASSRVDVFSSENRANIPVYPLDVFVITDEGTAQLKEGATRLPAEALEVLVLLDGKATVGDLEHHCPHIPAENLRDVIRALLAARLVRPATIEESEGLDFSAFFEATKPEGEVSEGTRASAGREADTGQLTLGRKGYYVSIARQDVKVHQPLAGGRFTIFLVEDDDDMAALVARLLEAEGFCVERAASRAEVVARLRHVPPPDAVLLDVLLPDVNGFEILGRLKQHPVLKALPVVMLTAEASRESVLRGLVGGADGYITKPFDRGRLVAGVKAVLGLGAQDPGR
jgi:two-component system OmpR family response regulator